MGFVAEHIAWMTIGLLVVMAVIAFVTHRKIVGEKLGEVAILALSTFLGVSLGLQQTTYLKTKEDREKLVALLAGVRFEMTQVVNQFERHPPTNAEEMSQDQNRFSLGIYKKLLESDLFFSLAQPQSAALFFDFGSRYRNLFEESRDANGGSIVAGLGGEEYQTEAKNAFNGLIHTMWYMACLQEQEVRGKVEKDAPFQYFVRETIWTGDMQAVGCAPPPKATH